MVGYNAITIKLMPESPSSNLTKLKEEAKKAIEKVGGVFNSSKEEPIAFGLVSLVIRIGLKEDQSADALEEELSKLENVKSVEIVDVRRAIG